MSVPFTGTPGATYTWTNDNPLIGLPASGSGGLDFTAASVSSPQTGQVTVTPTYGDCPGDPVTFSITVAATYVDDPPDITVCPGDAVAVPFTGNGTGYNWTNSNPGIGLAASGSGDIAFTASGSPAQQTGTITVTPQGGVCPAIPQSFVVTVRPAAAVNQPPDQGVCSGDVVDVVFGGSPGTVFSWTNDNPNVGLPASGSGDLSFAAAPVNMVQTATVTVTPLRGVCTGMPMSFQIIVNPLPEVSVPPDVNACVGDALSLSFGGSPGATVYWVNSNPGIGLPPSGSGDLSFTAAAQPTPPQTGLVSASAFDGTCYSAQETFQITVQKCCETLAGSMDTLGAAVCSDNPLLATFLGGDSLETGDTLHFILFSDPDDPIGSVLYESDTLLFPFLPGITVLDSTFYVAAIAGNQLPGDSIDRADPCLDVSNAQPLRWLSKPQITLVSTDHSVCAEGCFEATFAFAGRAPYQFDWVLEQGGQLMYSRSETALSDTLTIEVCTQDFDVPYTGGNLEFRVTGLMDAVCGCGD